MLWLTGTSAQGCRLEACGAGDGVAHNILLSSSVRVHTYVAHGVRSSSGLPRYWEEFIGLMIPGTHCSLRAENLTSIS